MEPVDRAFGGVFAHALHLVVESPAVVTIEIALEFSEEIRDQRMKVAGGDSGPDVWKQPALHRVIDLPRRPLPLLWRSPGDVLIDGPEEFRMLWEGRLGKPLRLPYWLRP
jgi:hypothetical protein